MKCLCFCITVIAISALLPFPIAQAESPYGNDDLVAPPVPQDVTSSYTYGENDSVPLSEVKLDNSLTNYDISEYETHTAECGCNSCSCCDWPILRWFEHSEAGFDNFISPMTNPVFFEDPRTLTEARFIFINNDFPKPVGGNYQLYALQIRAALNDRLSIVAAKDGLIIASPNAPNQDGAADIAVGLKYNLFADPASQRILSAGLSFELPVGSHQAWQGQGDGELNMYLTGGAEFWCNWHWLSTMGYRVAMNRNEEVDVFYWSNHIDRQLTNCWYGFAEANWYQYTRDTPNGPALGLNGFDLLNIGASDVAGKAFVTGALGIKYKPSPCTEIGLAFEAPMGRFRDLMEDRITFDWIFRY